MPLKHLLFFLYLISNHLFASVEAELLFHSTFDETTLQQPQRQNSPIWWQEIKSTHNSPFTWPIKLQSEAGSFQMIVNHDNIHQYIENRIVNVPDNAGQPTKALLQHIKVKEHPWTQTPYAIYTKNKEQKKLYLSYSLKYPKDLANILGDNSWLTFCQFKTKTDYRLAYYIYSDANQRLYWYAHGDNVVLDNIPYESYWQQENKAIPVPTGKWFEVEIFWNRSRGKDGRVWLAIDGQTVIHYQGPTKLKEPIHEIMLFTNYAAVPLKQWVDNIQVWSDFPCGEAQSCYETTKDKRP